MTLLRPQEPQEGASEVIQIPCGDFNFWIEKLQVAGLSGHASQYIIELDEKFEMYVPITFAYNGQIPNPLTRLLLCKGINLNATFAVEGFGTAPEVNLSAETVTTEKGKYDYVLKYVGTPRQAGLAVGVYKTAAMVTVNADDPCDVGPVGFGYVSDIIFQVYEQ